MPEEKVEGAEAPLEEKDADEVVPDAPDAVKPEDEEDEEQITNKSPHRFGGAGFVNQPFVWYPMLT